MTKEVPKPVVFGTPKAGELWVPTKPSSWGKLRIVSTGTMDNGKGSRRIAYADPIEGWGSAIMVSLESDGWFVGCDYRKQP